MAQSYDQIVLFGDSLFQMACAVQEGFSFQAALQDHFMRRLDVMNRGFSGYNTFHALQTLPEIFPPRKEGSPRLAYLIVLFGANDAVLPMPTTTQHVPIDKYRQFLQEIITHENIVAHKPKILLVTPPPLDEIRTTELDRAQGHASSQRQADVSAAYSEVAREVARANEGVVLIDLWKGIMERAIAMTPGFDPSGPRLGTPKSGQRGGLEQLLPDGLHMSGEAYKILYDLVLPHIGPEWKNLPDGDRTGYVFKDWKSMPEYVASE